MTSRSRANRPQRPHTSDNRSGGGVSGEKKRVYCLGLRRIWGYLTGLFTGTQSRRPNTTSPGSSRGLGQPAMARSAPEPGPQYRGLHHGGQERYRADMPVIPHMASTGYRPPPDLSRQVSEMPQGASSSTEVIIALMGVTGAGKSYFIREISGNSEVVVSGDLHSCKIVPCWRS
ncbi:hypothetical protein HOY82DRAFT_571643 [Tuber indicum]|nr:hypothetical protein HOY82DRAFT_571643 [Tuber indicum]